MTGIYKITNPKGRVYIGQSSNLEQRLYYYVKYFNRYKSSQRRLYNSFNKYGAISHIFEIVEECAIESLNERERYWQDHYDTLSQKGLNCRLTKTGERSGKVSKETVNNMRAARKGKPIGPFSEEAKKNMSEAREKTSYNKKGCLLQICDKTGKILNKYLSAKSAERLQGFSSILISQSVRTFTKHRGFYFLYEKDLEKIKYLPIGKTGSEKERERAFRKNGYLIATDYKTGELIQKFRSIQDAVEKGFTRTGIVKSKRDGSKHRGYIWKYEKK